jgi:hypothetical protein
MEVLAQHKVTDDQTKSTDWTTIGARILEAATLATAIHLDELSRSTARHETPRGEPAGSDREKSDGNGTN